MLVLLSLLLLNIYFVLSTIEFIPKDTRLEYTLVNESSILIRIGMTSLREKQDVLISERIKDSNGVTYPVSVRISLSPSAFADMLLSEPIIFYPPRVVVVDDLLCGSTSLNGPCVNRKTLCCVDLCRGTNYYKCYLPIDEQYMQQTVQKIDTTIGMAVSINDTFSSSETNTSFFMTTSDSQLTMTQGSLKFKIALKAEDYMESLLDGFISSPILHKPNSQDLTDTLVVLDDEIIRLSEESWIETATCGSATDVDYRFEDFTMNLKDFLAGDFEGIWEDNKIQITQKLDMMIEMVITINS